MTVTCGDITRKAACARPASAKSLATRLKNDPGFCRRWMSMKEPEQLLLSLEGGQEN